MTQDNWDLMPKKLQKAQAKHLVKNFKPTYNINLLYVYSFESFSLVINKESFVTKVFDSKGEAVDYCLDRYEISKHNEQIDLFNN